jgi:hypothetical protein
MPEITEENEQTSMRIIGEFITIQTPEYMLKH